MDLALLDPKLQNTSASAINNNGQVTGINFGTGHAFRFTDGVGAVDLHTGNFIDFQGQPVDSANFAISLGTAINNRGQVTGSVSPGFAGPTSVNAAFLFTDGAGLKLLGPNSRPQESNGNGINDLGQIVGSKRFSTATEFANPHAFLYTEGAGFVDLDVLPGNVASSANDVNNQGQVVGSSVNLQGDSRLAFLWTAQEGMQDLNSAPGVGGSGLVLKTAVSINDSGQIVGNAMSTVKPVPIYSRS